jgi:hypothetical protein
VKHPDFPSAPPGSYVCEEGWLIVGDEAWTPDEWARRSRGDVEHPRRYNGFRYDTDEERQAARRRSRREYNWRSRGVA